MPSIPDAGMDALTHDRNLAHLLDLLSLLPAPKQDPAFWTSLATYHGVDVSYVFQKMTLLPRMLTERTPASVAMLCEYLLLFFGKDDARLYAVLKTPTADLALGKDYDSGRWWAQDVQQTAWTLWVRYRKHGDQEWQNGWRATRWTSWLPVADCS
ncbi:hypothetical protein [Actinocorallia libanotica]|uniref:Uncharacterized protein n=1 Tax=Actinocorallia libanotica TaxID=46162 RepID=A0ABP4BW77_9ACTN